MNYRLLLASIICVHCGVHAMKFQNRMKIYKKEVIEIIDQELKDSDLKKIPAEKRIRFFRSKKQHDVPMKIYFHNYSEIIGSSECIECVEYKSKLCNVKHDDDMHEKQEKFRFKITSTLKPLKEGDHPSTWSYFPYFMEIAERSNNIFANEDILEARQYKDRKYNLIDQKDAIFDYVCSTNQRYYNWFHYSFNKDRTLFVVYVSGKERKSYNWDGLKSLGTSRLYLCATNPIRIIQCIEEFDLSFDDKFIDVYMSDYSREIFLSSTDGVIKFDLQENIQELILKKCKRHFNDLQFEFEN